MSHPGSAGQWPREGRVPCWVESCSAHLLCPLPGTCHSGHLITSRRPHSPHRSPPSCSDPSQALSRGGVCGSRGHRSALVICQAGAWRPFSRAQQAPPVLSKPPCCCPRHASCPGTFHTPQPTMFPQTLAFIIEKAWSHVVSWSHGYRLENQSCPFMEKRVEIEDSPWPSLGT